MALPPKNKGITALPEFGYGKRFENVLGQTLPIYERMAQQGFSDPGDRRNMAQGQALLKLAETALAYASPTEQEIKAGRSFSPAERLSQVTRNTQLIPTLSALGAQEQKAKDEERKALQQARFAAISSAERKIEAEAASKLKREEQNLQNIFTAAQLDKKTAHEIALQDSKYDHDKLMAGVKLANQASLARLGLANSIALAKANEKIKKRLMVLEEKAGDRARVAEYKLKERLAENNLNRRISELNVLNIFDLDKIELQAEKQEQLQNSKNALARELKQIDKEIAFFNREQRAQSDAENREIDKQKLALQQRKVELQEAAAKLANFGNSIDGKSVALMSDVEKLKAYSEGTASKEIVNQLQSAATAYGNITLEYDPNQKTQRFKLTRELPAQFKAALQKRVDSGFTVPVELSQAILRTSPQGTTVIKTETVSPQGPKTDVVYGVPVNSLRKIFGALPQGKELFQKAMDWVRGSRGDANILASRTALKNLNNNFIQNYRSLAKGPYSQGIRDSVFSQQRIEELLANPDSLLEGSGTAKSKIRSLVGNLEAIQDQISKQLAPDSGFRMEQNQVSEARSQVQQLRSYIDLYNVFLRATDAEEEEKRRKAQESTKGIIK